MNTSDVVNEPAGSIATTSITNNEPGSTTTASNILSSVPSSDHPIASPANVKRKKAKKARDPNEPKKNLTSYVLFSNYIRPIIKERMPGISFVDLSKQMGLEFRQLSSEDREIWNVKAREEKKRYDLEMEEYRKTGVVKPTKETPTKKGRSSYNFYFQAMHDKMKADNPNISFAELSRKIGQNYKNLPNEDKTQWEDMAKEDRKRLDGGHVPEGKKKVKKSKRNSDAPKKNLTSYIYFSNAIREEMKQRFPQATFCELGKLMGAEFKKLTPEQRKVYDDLAAKDKIRYNEAMVEYETKKRETPEQAVAAATAVVVAEIVESVGEESPIQATIVEANEVVEC